tara:strand:- start:828 stop:2033 length:1206 start_codon:yes stop_codon:yes gene_type:complete
LKETPYFIQLEEALSICKKTDLTTGFERVSLDECHYRILALDLESKVDDPPFDNSAMDGYAMKYEDTLDVPSKLKVIGTIQAAGQEDNIVVGKGEAVRIMTGAPMPKGADSILQIELTSQEGDEVILQQPSMKHFIRKKGENLRKDEVALEAGSLLTPSRIGLCATMGHSTVPVVKRLKVAIISTGNELKQPGAELERGQIYESNSFGISGLVNWLGHIPVRMHSVGDTIEDLREALNQASAECDVILTSGGVSMGEWDLVRKIMEEEGDIHFWRVKLRPGSPPLFGKWNNTPIFGLPGNPVSSHVVFRMLVAPWIRHNTLTSEPAEIIITAKLSTKVKSSKDCLTLRRVSVERKEGSFYASQKIHQGSGNIASMALSEGLVILKPGIDYSIGDSVDVMLL